jgi:hypothetical protein
MRVNNGIILILITLIVLPTMVCALVPDDITIWSDPNWAVAGGGKVSIYVTVENATLGGGISGATVKVTVEDSSMGKIQPATQKTKNGALSQPFAFTPSTRSGMAGILITVDYTSDKIDYHAEKVYLQPIDHAIPSVLGYLQTNATVPAGALTDLVVQYRDAYGNPIDSKFEEASPAGLTPEKVIFSDSLDGDGGFWDGSGYLHSIALPVNETGYVAVKYKVATAGGNKILSIRGPANVTPSVTFVTIKGIGTAPTAIVSNITPSNGIVYANNQDTLSLLYTVLDSYGNPVPGISFWRNTSLGENERFVTNSEGKALTVYGPKKSIGKVNITAMVEGSPQISVTNTVEFVQSEAVMWELTASPQTLASRDVNPSVTAEIRAKVMDTLGNPVEGELVSFILLSHTNTTNLTILPSLEATSALTDADGYAIVKFHPGGFPGPNDAGFDANASGTAMVGASWNGKSKTIPISFRNYPYLRVETEVSPMTIETNSTINVTVRLIGDGYALIAKPIDVDLVFDRSTSMSQDTPTRISQAKIASKTFVDQMNAAKDRVGLVSFSSSTTLDQSLTPSLSTVKTKIDSLNANGYTQLRNATYTAITDVKNQGRTGAIRAVILMTDGEWNYDGTPLAQGTGWPSNNTGYNLNTMTMETNNYRWYPGLGGNLTLTSSCIQYTYDDYCVNCAFGYTTGSNGKCCNRMGSCYLPSQKSGSCDEQRRNQCVSYGSICTDGQFTEQNMSIYAKNNHVRIYAIAFAQQLDPVAVAGLQSMANYTGGFYEYAPDEATLAQIYKRIAGDLRIDAAAIDTEMDLDFESLNVTYDNLTTLMPGRDVFSYQYLNSTSTYVSSWNTTLNPLPGHVPSYPYTIDQTADWQQTPPRLNFSIGNISINQTWEATFQFVVKVPGNIDIFGRNSVVRFGGDGGVSYQVPIPTSYVTVLQNDSVIETPGNLLALEGLPSSGDVCMGSRDLEFQWTLNYTGNGTVLQNVYYQSSEDGHIWTGDWIYLTTIDAGTGPFDNQTFNVGLDTQDRVGYFKIKVDAGEDCVGGLQDEWVSSPSLSKTCGSIKIS